jgi:hypothetical protein
MPTIASASSAREAVEPLPVPRWRKLVLLLSLTGLPIAATTVLAPVAVSLGLLEVLPYPERRARSEREARPPRLLARLAHGRFNSLPSSPCCWLGDDGVRDKTSRRQTVTRKRGGSARRIVGALEASQPCVPVFCTGLQVHPGVPRPPDVTATCSKRAGGRWFESRRPDDVLRTHT